MALSTRSRVAISCTVYACWVIVACSVWLRYADFESLTPAGKAQRVSEFRGLGCDVVTAEYVEEGLGRARSDGYDVVAIVLDTPGGHLEATREIVQRMLASEVPVVVWVGPAGARAASAGVFLTMAADFAAMHPASNIGAAHPVLAGGQDVAKEAGADMARKVENDTAAFARSIAAARVCFHRVK